MKDKEKQYGKGADRETTDGERETEGGSRSYDSCS